MAFSLICRTLSRVRPNFSPISSKVISWVLIPKNNLIISLSLSVKVDKALSTSVESDSLINVRSAIGESSFTNTSSKLLSSPSTKGASLKYDVRIPLTYRPLFLRANPMNQPILQAKDDVRSLVRNAKKPC